MGRSPSGEHITGGHIHIDIITWNDEEPQLQLKSENLHFKERHAPREKFSSSNFDPD